MISRFNLHTHTSLCDGKNTVEEMVTSAIELGCDGIGFSGHSTISTSLDWTMSESREQRYIAEVNEMKEKYGDRIEVLLGIEYDVLSDIDTSPYDYVIGSVHHSVVGNVPIDLAADDLKKYVDELFGGDFYALAEDYYGSLSGVVEKTGCDIVAHFDLVTKFNEGGELFDQSNKRYRDAAFGCLEALLRKDVIFEINTGAISRGYRKSPYPSKEILTRMAELRAKITVTTDCHSAGSILCAYDDAIALARECGVRELYFPKNKIFVPYKI